MSIVVNVKPEDENPKFPDELPGSTPALIKRNGYADKKVVVRVGPCFIFASNSEKLTYSDDYNYIKRNYTFIRYLTKDESLVIKGQD